MIPLLDDNTRPRRSRNEEIDDAAVKLRAENLTLDVGEACIKRAAHGAGAVAAEGGIDGLLALLDAAAPWAA